LSAEKRPDISGSQISSHKEAVSSSKGNGRREG